MRNSIANFLRRVANWLSPSTSVLVVTKAEPLPLTPYTDTADAICRAIEEQFPGTSGEYRRRQAYARLIKVYPGARKRDLGLALELAISRW